MNDTKGAAYPQPCDCPQVTVDVVIFCLRDGDLQVLLVRRPRSAAGPQSAAGPETVEMWAIPGGRVGSVEGLQAAAARTLAEETGVRDVFLEQLYTFGEPGRDPEGRVISVAYFAAVPARAVVAQAFDTAGRVRWWSIYHLPPLALDHDSILRYALTRLRYKLEYTAVGFELLPDTFTLTELQAAYEVVLGEALDKRNFRRKILSAGVIELADGYRTGEGRPARLYRYRADAVAQVSARRLFP